MRCPAVAAGMPGRALLVQRVWPHLCAALLLQRVRQDTSRGGGVGQVLLLQRALLLTPLLQRVSAPQSPPRGSVGPEGVAVAAASQSSPAGAAGGPNLLLQRFGPPISFEDIRVRGPHSDEGDGGNIGDLHSPDGPHQSPCRGNPPGCGCGSDARGIAHTRSRGWDHATRDDSVRSCIAPAAHHWGRPVLSDSP